MATSWESDDTEMVAHEDDALRDLSSCTPERSVSPKIRDEVQDALLASKESTDYRVDHADYHTSREYQQHQCGVHTSEYVGSRLRSYPSHQPVNEQSSGLASPPELAEDISVMPQMPGSYAPQPAPNHPWAFVQPSPTQPLQASFPPYAMFGHQSTNHVYSNPPTYVSLTLLPRFISWIDEAKVRDYLAIAVVRHKDIHDMVETEYERIARERHDQINEDASVLSFVKEHIRVQKLLFQEYDDFPNSTKQEIIHRAVMTINQTIMAIPSHVRPGSNWKTKFNAFLTLVWIGRAIADGIGMLPNVIRAQMAGSPELVTAIDRVYAMMSKAEILNDGARLLDTLIELERKRDHCFQGLEEVVKVFQEAMRHGRTS